MPVRTRSKTKKPWPGPLKGWLSSPCCPWRARSGALVKHGATKTVGHLMPKVKRARTSCPADQDPRPTSYPTAGPAVIAQPCQRYRTGNRPARNFSSKIPLIQSPLSPFRTLTAGAQNDLAARGIARLGGNADRNDPHLAHRTDQSGTLPR